MTMALLRYVRRCIAIFTTLFANDYVTTEISVGKTCHEAKLISGRFLDGFGLSTLVTFLVDFLQEKRAFRLTEKLFWTFFWNLVAAKNGPYGKCFFTNNYISIGQSSRIDIYLGPVGN
jgi:hypothetical protein